MKFGITPLKSASGAILAHSTHLKTHLLKKGHLLTNQDLIDLEESGFSTIMVAKLEKDDVREDPAAKSISKIITGKGVKLGTAFTGRCNLVAEFGGLLNYSKEYLDTVNLTDERVTIAMLEPYTPVIADQLVGTIKIIPFSIPRNIINKIELLVKNNKFNISLSPFIKKKIGLIMTHLPKMKEKVLDKTSLVTGDRVASFGSKITKEVRCEHTQDSVQASLLSLTESCDIILIIGATAVVDREDILPASLVNIGGKVEHFGMPVDPGNLLFLGNLKMKPVVGLPGCARSPKLNGFDWILQRLLANITISSREIMLMGSKGLLKEISERGQLRQDDNKE